LSKKVPLLGSTNAVFVPKSAFNELKVRYLVVRKRFAHGFWVFLKWFRING
jgi:hypothetical protein